MRFIFLSGSGGSSLWRFAGFVGLDGALNEGFVLDVPVVFFLFTPA